jgi:hypothetical protein
MKINNNVPLIILGMHRSGTSLFASWLDKCGINMGDKMLGAGVGNPKGHFEDIEFYEFNVNVLKKNKLNYIIQKQKILKFDKEDHKMAKSIYQSHSNVSSWGWKDPRTCLTINFWHSIIPDYKVIYIFRDYNQVVDSLFRRNVNNFKKRKNLLLKAYKVNVEHGILKNRMANKYLMSWVEYNRKVINHLKVINNSNVIVINEKNIHKLDSDIFKILSKKWNYKELNFSKYSELFDPSLFKTKSRNYLYNNKIEKLASKYYKDLELLEVKSFKLHKIKN